MQNGVEVFSISVYGGLFENLFDEVIILTMMIWLWVYEKC